MENPIALIEAHKKRIDAMNEDIEIAQDAMSLDLFQAVYRSNELPLSIRMRAAALAIQFESPKLACVAQITEKDFATLLDQRIERLNRMKMIEAKPTPTANENGGRVDARLPPPIPDRRFRRI